MNSRLKKLCQEKSALLEEWPKTAGLPKIKILIRLMDIDDELSEVDGGGGSNAFGSGKRRVLPPLFQKKKSI